MNSQAVSALIDLALKEDVGTGDITSNSLISEALHAEAQIISREDIVVCGQAVAEEVFQRVDAGINYELLSQDGQRVSAGSAIASVKGPFRSILTAERTALNFLQHLTAISTNTAQIVQSVSHTGVRVLDTRKTTPGWRELEKYAVKTGGGTNHRHGLYDAVLIKNNHLDALGGDIGRAIRLAREKNPRLKIEVEVRDERELRQALAAQPDAILLDNMSLEELRNSVAIAGKHADKDKLILEASGGINRDTVVAVAETGIDAVSMGSLTHSVRAVDLALHYSNNLKSSS